MKHSNSGRKFSRTPSHRKALLMNLSKALIMHGRIQTTEAKAKDLRSVVEKLVTLAKRNDLHSRRLAYRELNDHAIVKHLFDKVAPVYAEIPGGYTRVIKLAKHRKGDNAPMAIIEFRDPAESVKKKASTPGTTESEATTPIAPKDAEKETPAVKPEVASQNEDAKAPSDNEQAAPEEK